MVDWNSPAEIAKDMVVLDRFLHSLLGIYAWEFCTSFNFDWQFITLKKRFRWPLVFYFLNRYCMLFSVTAAVVSHDITTKVDCQALYTFTTLCGTFAIGFSSINQSLRTQGNFQLLSHHPKPNLSVCRMAVWSRRWYIVVPLVTIILGHWSLLLHGVLIKATFVEGKGCVITDFNRPILLATWIYTMIFDFIILSLTAIKLVQREVAFRSKLMELVFRDGLISFIVALLSNVVATTLLLLNLNPVMSLIACTPAAMTTTIAACRVVRRLKIFTHANAEIHCTNAQVSAVALVGRQMKVSKVSNVGVHVQMEMETFQSPPLEDIKDYMRYDNPNQGGKEDGRS